MTEMQGQEEPTVGDQGEQVEEDYIEEKLPSEELLGVAALFCFEGEVFVSESVEEEDEGP